MASKNLVYIDLTTDISGCSDDRHNDPLTQTDSRTTQIVRLGQRHAHGSSYVDLTMEMELDPADPLYDHDRERVFLEEMRGMLQNPPP
jgi:hypothetical protein